MTALNKSAFAGITYGVMGLGTEGGATPYKMTVTANGTKVIGKSGYSIGAMQFDFGQRGDMVNPLTSETYSESFVNAVNDWASKNGKPLLTDAVFDKLDSKGSSLIWMNDAEKSTITAFGATDHGQNWVNTNLEKGLIAEYEPKVSSVLNNRILTNWSESDIIVATAILAKAQNQSPNNGLNKLINEINSAKDGYSIDDFLMILNQYKISTVHLMRKAAKFGISVNQERWPQNMLNCVKALKLVRLLKQPKQKLPVMILNLHLCQVIQIYGY